jgi:nicotinamidase-related amidase
MHANRTLLNSVCGGLLVVTAAVMRLAAQGPAAPGAPLPYYPNSSTALLVVDPYNDFLSDGGKLWERTRETATSQHLIEHMQQALSASRAAGIKVVIVPHRRYRPGDWEGSKYLPYRGTLEGIQRGQLFALGTWGGEFRKEFTPQSGDVIASEHWISSGFANTDLDMQLKQHGIDHIVLVGMRANTCIESTLRDGVELGYHTTVLSDAVAAFNPTELKASLAVNYPIYAHALLSTEQFVAAVAASKSSR